ncbi:Hypothetical predicted protein [Cloeon dipterum]|uniref:FP protein C-terminal domain-containing protein n=1 Tax=Cloeon dipterum TaxID=197152 RepID=A0A8S1E2P3_9INSE|nr:Hypothetical predicted protein [Cloeon dipterum]
MASPWLFTGLLLEVGTILVLTLLEKLIVQIEFGVTDLPSSPIVIPYDFQSSFKSSADFVKCKVCNLAVAHPGCAAKSKTQWACSSCRADSDSTKAGSNPPSNPSSEAGDLITDQLGNLAANMNARFDAAEESRMNNHADFERALEFLSSKYDELLKTIGEQNKTISELRKGMEAFTSKLKEKDSMINLLALRVNELEQSAHSLSIEIHGVPRAAERENLHEVLGQLAQQVGAPQPSLENVADAYRLPARTPRAVGQRPRGEPPIAIKFKDASVRLAWLAGRRRLQQQRPADVNREPVPSTSAAAVATPAPRPDGRMLPPIRIYERLTAYNKRLLYLTRGAATAKGYKFVWVKEGKIFVRRSEQLGALIRIRCEEDIRTKLDYTAAEVNA